jgi:Spo7-like protein
MPPIPSDPTLHIPASPPQIYLNLLILEASLRSQYLTLRARRRQNTFVLTFLGLWIAYFFYCQFLRPREDGTGVGGSVYWVLDMFEKVALISGMVMGVLFRLTGQWERGVRWPSRWLRTTNRGLRGMNCKAVVLKGAWWREMISHLSFLLPISYFVETPGSNYQYIEYSQHERRPSQHLQPPSKRRDEKASSRHEVAEEDIAPGGDYIKMLLLPKHFTPEFRENWEIYRAEYWDVENQRRAELRARMRARRKALAKQQSPWTWWIPGRTHLSSSSTTPFSRISPSPSTMRAPSHESAGSISRTGSLRQQQHKRASSSIKGVFSTEPTDHHSRSSSRSSLPPFSATAPAAEPEEHQRERRWSSSTTSSLGAAVTTGGPGERRRRKVTGSSSDVSDSRRTSLIGPSGRVKLTPASGSGSGSSSRPSTPTSDGLKGRLGGGEGDSTARRIKMEPLD